MPSAKSRKRGYAFLILMMMVTILLISLTAALPSIYTAGQREKEEELIFRGNEYARAVLFFRRKFGRFPSSINEMVKKTNGIRFLRHAYPDPMTPKGQWRFIHANAAGMVLDSKTMNTQVGPGNRNLQNPQSSQTSQTSQTSDSTPAEAKGGDSATSTNEMKGAFIVGVASSSRKSSIRIYNNRTRYDEWEFLGIDQPLGGGTAPGGSGTAPGQTTTPAGPGQNSGQNPGQNPGQSNDPVVTGPPPNTGQPNSPE